MFPTLSSPLGIQLQLFCNICQTQTPLSDYYSGAICWATVYLRTCAVNFSAAIFQFSHLLSILE